MVLGRLEAAAVLAVGPGRDHLFISFDSASLVCFSLPNNSSTSVSATDIPNYAGLDFFR